MEQKFDPLKWLPEQQNVGHTTVAATHGGNDSDRQRVECALDAIEASCIDLTADYTSWRDLGFALAHGFGESGREYFHRVSQFYPEYRTKVCDEQYDRCLRSTGSGISLATFFHHVKQAGIQYNPATTASASPGAPAEAFSNPGSDQQVEEDFEVEDQKNLPLIPESVYASLPKFLQETVKTASGEVERDLLLLGSLTVLSSALPNVFGTYDSRKVYSNLYLFVTAPASSGKGSINLCKRLVLPLHRFRREEARLQKEEYESLLAAHNAGQTSEKPPKPQERMHLIPANSSTTGIFQLLGDNGGQGLIFESEADSMANVLKTDYGNYSDGFRKAFHHEAITYFRRTDREYVDIETPCLSTLLTGTPRQVASLVPNAENGLFSRFLFYYLDLEPVWKDVFEDDSRLSAQEHFDHLGEAFLEFHQRLVKTEGIRFQLTNTQKQQFFDFFSQTQLRYLAIMTKDYVATVRRMGLICFRLAMVLTSLRMMESGRISSQLLCSDEDFNSALAMVSALIKHSSYVYHILPEERGMKRRTNKKERFLELLPVSFDRTGYTDIASKIGIPPKTAEKYIYGFVDAKLVERQEHGLYALKVDDKPELAGLEL